jgi:hypothetical protein
MKRMLATAVMMLITVVMFAQSNNLYWTMTVKVKMDKRLEYEKKFVTFLKTHYPNLKLRTWEVMTGENTGAFVFVMGPTSYKELDVPLVSPKGEGQLKLDAQALDALTESSVVSHGTRVEAASMMKADRKLKYIQVNSYEIKIATWGNYRQILVKSKEARKAGGSKIDYDIFRPTNSGPGNAFSLVMYCNTLEELTLSESFEEMYNKSNANSYITDLAEWNSNLLSQRTELRVLRADLSQL